MLLKKPEEHRNTLVYYKISLLYNQVVEFKLMNFS
jgi:hypothetical protein